MRGPYCLFLLVALSLGMAPAARGQDDSSPSLGDVARQSRLAKQQRDSPAGKTSAAQVPNAGNAASVTNDISNQNSASPASSQPGQTPASGKSLKKVITNEDLGAAHSTEDSAPASTANSKEKTGSIDEKYPPDYWTTRILAQKNAIASAKSDVDKLSASIQYAPGNCVEGCSEWNQRQQEKQQQVDDMKARLEEMQKQLEDMQESARKQGYGSSVYDP